MDLIDRLEGKIGEMLASQAELVRRNQALSQAFEELAGLKAENERLQSALAEAETSRNDVLARIDALLARLESQDR